MEDSVVIPWDEDWTIDEPYEGAGQVRITCDGRWIADFDLDDSGPGRCALAAAAPDMYRLIKRMLKHYTNEDPEMLKEIDRVMSKARGE